VTKHITVDTGNGPSLFVLKRLTSNADLKTFDCSIQEYNDYLKTEALKAQNELIAVTWLLYERKSDNLVAYMSLINDAIKLNATEKELHHLNYPFRTIPALKIAKLAVSRKYKEVYKGVGSYMIYLAAGIADTVNFSSACRFLTVDADIEHDKNILAFYQKNNFIQNAEFGGKNRKTISMRLDIFPT
jgi:hypothetical protein